MIAVRTNVKLKEVQNMLGEFEKDAPKVLARAVNATAKEVQKDLFHEAKETYVIKASAFKSKSKALKLKRATQSNLVAHLNSEGGPLALYGFRVKATDSDTKAKVKKSNGMKNLLVDDRWAFVTSMGSGHTGVFQRTGSARLPIHEFFSVSVPQMIGNEKEVYGKLEPDFKEMLQRNIEREVEKLLSQKARQSQ